MTHPVHTPVVAADGALIRFALADLLSGRASSMRIELSDAGAAEPWLTRLVGTEAGLDALGKGHAEVPARPELARLALLLWIRRWWPAGPSLGVPSLDPALLDLETAVATAAVEDLAEGLLDGFEASPAELFDTAIADDALMAAAPPVADEVRGLCGRLASWFDDQDDVVRAEAAAEMVARLDAAAPGQRAYALAAGTDPVASGEGVLASGRASVDWARVPPGILDAAEDTVTWRIVMAAATARLEVDVAGAFADAALTATALHDGEPFAEVPLSLGAGRFTGAADLDEASTQLAASVQSGRITLVVGVAGEGVTGTTAEDRAEVVALVRARPPEDRTLAERAAAASTEEEF
ncbi:hypothetical protein [Amycolatopsis regifaucium]|uniref:Uncharacterized protein n=1 Tax=Amycolatopsis regifaucium TaxID=546365 RepID=A0A154MVX4_9PSEU|nr:hypothetical protein [Amycolatopsis regifaucium]KZB88524.1 hypothetical protein AVL48_00075 [Amycolatopsis regifaucium]OKA07305.1 hypothetical protein ATP06_0215715 [Amycolatopsis regifaucium]SFI49630.1 hypothetical protein SAMN04489731_11114 [Amycolatopsis regifaucium]